ncbi:class I SAM-dependent methyltransferase [Leptospira vanthielii]|uniref:Methyltransferase domain protein n=1 Tax=Leptospira vanthielii serovar Holland str. Waz Holland = ATCC 700522 TaxID=1218591 RepID=N1WE58_9LEPT|nr:class I SAM-dependent methyltransferase [Leptospira vanthielii]EMY71497.1 methyltransferase domain protein [Leptospira vanthielii serovar Holland str. Waz Holland = ATCC 700522]
MDKQLHWETIYKDKQPNEVSWTQSTPSLSLKLIQNANPSKTANIIDVGGGESLLVDYLLDLGFENLTILDISKNALDRCKNRIGNKGKNLNWVVSDITEYHPETSFSIWHDRAVFHFLTGPTAIAKYKANLLKTLSPDGEFIIGTFSTEGPKKCSGLDIKQYTEESLTDCFSPELEPIEFQREDHETPFHTIQNFVFGRFKRVN